VTEFGGALYFTKGSGSNGIDTVYTVPSLPTVANVAMSTIGIVPGFPTDSAKATGASSRPSTSGDNGADPNKVVVITDQLSDTTLTALRQLNPSARSPGLPAAGLSGRSLPELTFGQNKGRTATGLLKDFPSEEFSVGTPG
jgi:hypothetical protein